MNDNENYYALIGVEPMAEPEQIKQAYLRSALQCHPDRGGSDAGMVRLAEAWEVLRDRQLRRIYDHHRGMPEDPDVEQQWIEARTRARARAEEYPKTWPELEKSLAGVQWNIRDDQTALGLQSHSDIDEPAKDESDYYQLLCLSHHASQQEINDGYRQQARLFHPDLGGSRQQMKRLAKAWEVLHDPRRRAAYDRYCDNPADRDAQSAWADISAAADVRAEQYPATWAAFLSSLQHLKETDRPRHRRNSGRTFSLSAVGTQWVGSIAGLVILAIILTETRSCGNNPDTIADGSRRDEINSSTVRPVNRNFEYCLAIITAEKKYPLAGETDVVRVVEKCEALFFELQSLPASGVDRRFLDWTSRYSDVLMDMKSAFRRYAARFDSEYQGRIMVEAFLRGYQGDFGTPIEEGRRYDQDVAMMQDAIDRRLRLLGELTRLYNETAPPGQRMTLSK